MYKDGDLTFVKAKCLHCGWFGSLRYVQNCTHCRQDALNKCLNQNCYCQKKPIPSQEQNNQQ